MSQVSLWSAVARGPVVAVALSASALVAPVGAQTASDASAELLDGTLQRYCITCHNDRLRTGGLSLADLDLTRIGEHAELWEGVVAKLRARSMPPVGRPLAASELRGGGAGLRPPRTPSRVYCDPTYSDRIQLSI